MIKASAGALTQKRFHFSQYKKGMEINFRLKLSNNKKRIELGSFI